MYQIFWLWSFALYVLYVNFQSNRIQGNNFSAMIQVTLHTCISESSLGPITIEPCSRWRATYDRFLVNQVLDLQVVCCIWSALVTVVREALGLNHWWQVGHLKQLTFVSEPFPSCLIFPLSCLPCLWFLPSFYLVGMPFYDLPLRPFNSRTACTYMHTYAHIWTHTRVHSCLLVWMYR